MTWGNITLGTGVLALVGWGAMLYKRRVTPPPPTLPRKPLALDERLLLILIYATCILRFVAAVWYPFFEYDPLWVYAYEGKLYALLGYIPEHIGYYPQLLPLSYTYAQLAFGGINDHAARAAFPIFQWGAAMAAYCLGAQLFTRRTGIYLAALWTLYPHVAQWSIYGDLEIPLTFGFTGASLFFIQAWTATERRPRLHYAALAGFFLGVTMWTKPTGGAFILGVGALILFEAARVRLTWALLRPRFEVAIITGLFSIPLGAVWYLRNIALGHRAIDFPHPFWLTQANRSGVEFGWPLLALGVLLIALYTTKLRARPSLRWVLVGVMFVLTALFPSIVNPHRLGWGDWVMLAIGIGLLTATLYPYLREHASEDIKRDVSRVWWLLLLAAPYFIVWFMSYSYHYRLSFPIVPLMTLPTALILARWLKPQHGKTLNWRYGLPLLLAGLPGVFLPIYHFQGGWDVLWSNEYPDDASRQLSSNFALALTVGRIERGIQEANIVSPVIFAPGLQRLPFFFPLNDVRITETPTNLRQLEGVDFYIFTQEARWLYEENDQPAINPVTGAMGRPEVMNLIGCSQDSSFFGCVYRVRPSDERFKLPPRATPVENTPTWGDFATLSGFIEPENTVLGGERTPNITLAFIALKPANLEYTIYAHLIDANGTYITGWDALPASTEYAHYSTRFWETGEIIRHRVRLAIPDDITLDPGGEYRIRIGLYDVFADNTRLPVQFADGTTDDGLTLPVTFTAK
jgi:4-amino-4-deoxy-L-arabinose transferase-like glycosyltransferase